MTNDIKFELKSVAEAEQLGFISIKKADSLTTKSQSKITRLCRENYGNLEKVIAKVLNDKGLYSYYIKREFFEKEFKDFLIVNSEQGRGVENIKKETTTANHQKKADLNERDHEETHASAIVKRAYKDELAIVRKENEKKLEAIKKENSLIFRKTVYSIIIFSIIIIAGLILFFMYHNKQMNKIFNQSKNDLIESKNREISDKSTIIDKLNKEVSEYKLKENTYINQLTELNKAAGKNEAIIEIKTSQLKKYEQKINDLQSKIETLQNPDTKHSFF